MYVYFSPLTVSLFPLLYRICRYLDDWYRSLCLQCVEITAKIEEKLGKVTYTQVYSPCVTTDFCHDAIMFQNLGDDGESFMSRVHAHFFSAPVHFCSPSPSHDALPLPIGCFRLLPQPTSEMFEEEIKLTVRNFETSGTPPLPVYFTSVHAMFNKANEQDLLQTKETQKNSLSQRSPGGGNAGGGNKWTQF
jgi:hypothetical protein